MFYLVHIKTDYASWCQCLATVQHFYTQLFGKYTDFDKPRRDANF